MKPTPSKWTVLAAIFVAGVGLDQWAKFLAVDRLTTLFQRVGAATAGQKLAAYFTHKHLEAMATDPYVVFAPLWRMVYVENPNAAFGLGHFIGPGPRRAIFLVAALVAAGAVIHYFRQLRDDQRWFQVALSLVLAGALGNFVDRALRGYVIDFVDWYWWNRPDLRWPTFNVADSTLVVGVALLLLRPFPAKGDAAGDGKA
jgi:signal peptidase II